MRAILLTIFSTIVVVPVPACSQDLSPIPEYHLRGSIRVFYAIDGKSAVPLADADSNGVPDHVEDIAKQLWAAHQLFCEVLDFPNPLRSERYPDATCIQVGLRERDEIGGGNGVAFESAQRAKNIPEGKPNDRALIISIGKHVDAKRNITPAHELFHLIQYSTTYFKNRWYLEGMARWAEHALDTGGVGEIKYPLRGPWPQKPANLPMLFMMTYDAEFVLWNPLAKRADPKGTLSADEISKELGELRYSDGSLVLRDHDLNGAGLMREILLELGKVDDVAFKELDFEGWTEENQKSEKNDRYIYQAVMDSLRRVPSRVGPFKAK